nr:hypothetical protein [Leifsonia sp. Leaf325]
MTTHPELLGSDEDDDDSGRPPLGARRGRMLRAVVWVGIVALVLPGILVTWGVAQGTASRACATYAAYLRPDAGGSSVGFELFAAGGPGWQCYAVSTSGPKEYLGSLGLIPSAPHMPGQTA